MAQEPEFNPIPGAGQDGASDAPLPAEVVRREVDPAAESLQGALLSGFQLLRLGMLVLIVFYFLTGLFRVEANERGLVTRVGVLQGGTDGTEVYQPGWYIQAPTPIDEKLTLPTKVFELDVVTFAYQIAPNQIGKPLKEISAPRTITPGQDGVLLTGDQNLSHALWKVSLEIRDPQLFVRNIADSFDVLTVEGLRANTLVKHLVESTIMDVVASRSVDAVLSSSSELIDAVQVALQRELDQLETGLKVTKVTGEFVAPSDVERAYRAATDAENDREQRIRQGETEAGRSLTEAAGDSYREILPLIDQYGAAQALGADEAELSALRTQIDNALDEAGGEVAQLLESARGQRTAYIDTVTSEYELFKQYLPQFQRDPQSTRIRLWATLMTELLGTGEFEVFAVADAGEIEIIVNRDQQRARDIETERLRGQVPGAAR